MTDHPVGLAIVGCGRLTELGYLPALGHVPGARLVGLVDPDPIRRERAAGIASARGDAVPTFGSLASLLTGAQPDAVVLASPAAAHLDGARAATAAGAAVLVEKPPAPDGDGAAALAELSPPPRIAFNRRFDPGVQRLRAQVPVDGDVALDLTLRYRRRSWRAHTVHDDALDDLGPHLVDWARWITGREIVDATARDVSFARAVVDLTLDRGTARLEAASDRLHAERIHVRGHDGRTIARWSRGGPVRAVTGRLRPGDHPLVTSLAAQLRAFVATVRGGPSPDLASAADGVAAMRTIEAARASAASGGAIVPVRCPPREVS